MHENLHYSPQLGHGPALTSRSMPCPESSHARAAWPVIAGVAVSPYGMLPVAPEVGTPPIPENRVGIAARPMSGLGPPRQAAFVAARSLTPRSGARLRPSLARRVSRCLPPASSQYSCLLNTCLMGMPVERLLQGFGQDIRM